MILDGHIHMKDTVCEKGGEELLKMMLKAGIDGGMVISPDPCKVTNGSVSKPGERLNAVMAFCKGHENLFPCYWIDAVAQDALEQVEAAAEAGVDAFKVICGAHYPGDERAMKVYGAIASHKKPVLFHSGILWDGRPSAKYNRPGEFECLLDIQGLKFTLAHVSWPWCDECIAVLGKFMNAAVLRPELSTEMFVDLAPGTPARWRREVLEKLFCGDYDVLHNIIFGTDCEAVAYNVQWAAKWLECDGKIYKELGLLEEEGFAHHIYSENLLRFLGKSKELFEKKLPRVAE